MQAGRGTKYDHAVVVPCPAQKARRRHVTEGLRGAACEVDPFELGARHKRNRPAVRRPEMSSDGPGFGLTYRLRPFRSIELSRGHRIDWPDKQGRSAGGRLRDKGDPTPIWRHRQCRWIQHGRYETRNRISSAAGGRRKYRRAAVANAINSRPDRPAASQPHSQR